MWIEESPDCQKLRGSQATRIPNFYRFSCLMPFGGSQCTPATSMQSQIPTQSDPTHARIGAWVRQVYCVMHARRPQGRRDQRPVHSNARPANLLKFPAPARGAWASVYGIASRCGDDACVAVGACTQARLEAGNCEEGFTCLFQGRPYSRIRSALAVPCLFAAGCPRRVCRDSYSIFGLF